MQGFSGLLHVLGSTFPEFIENLNNLHLHISVCWPAMMAPSFCCEQVCRIRLLLHGSSIKRLDPPSAAR